MVHGKKNHWLWDVTACMKIERAMCMEQSLPGVEGLAIATSVQFMLDLQRNAFDNEIEPGPSCTGGWKPWLQAVKAAGQGHLPPGTPAGMHPFLST